MAPTSIKAVCHPQFTAIHGTVNGAKMAPTFDPELKIPVAKDLSFLGKYSAVALIAAGKFPDSPKPKTALESINPEIEMGTALIPTQAKTLEKTLPIGIENACIIAPRDQMIIAKHKSPFCS